jgi:hypothetical protein
MSVALKINEELNGVELYFAAKPMQETLTVLKSNGFRWSGFKKCWYSKQSEKTMQLANSLVTNNEVSEVTAPVEKVAVKKQTKKETLSLWESTQWKGIELTQAQKDQDCKEIAKELRTHVRKQFPQVKFSITVPYYGKINFSIKSSPFEEGSIYLKAILGYCNNLVNAYQICYDAGDAYSDIPASYNFHFFKADTHWDYTQTEVTEDVKKDIAEFDAKHAEFEAAEEARKEAEYYAWKAQSELETIEYNKRMEEEKKQVENIYNSVEVVELEETTQYFVTGAEFANLNKNNTLEQYQEEVKSGKYSIENVKITKEVHFNNPEALESFSNMLLNDFDFLANTGGSYTDDNRINSMTDFYNMDEIERTSVKWNLYGVAIYFNNELQFVVDAQGYNYARYVGLTNNVQIEKSVTVDQVVSDEEIAELKAQVETLEDISVMVIEELNIVETWQKESWKEYKEAMKDKLTKYNCKLSKGIIQQIEIESLKVCMYKLLQEVDGIQDQFKKADIQQGEKVTMFYISDWGSITTNRITFNSAEPSKYAQHDNAVKVTFTPEKQRKLHYKHFYSTLLVFKGWHSLPDTVLSHVEERNGMRITRSKYSSCDNKQYDEILNHFENMGIKSIINTYKPTF